MVEVVAPCWSSRRYLKGDVLNPDRIEAYYVRAKTKKRCLELLKEKTRMTFSYNTLREYGSSYWGTYIQRPDWEGEGIWVTRDFSDKVLIEFWVERD